MQRKVISTMFESQFKSVIQKRKEKYTLILTAFCSTFTQVIVYSFTISKISSHDVPKKARRGLPPSLILLCFCQTLLVSIISVFVLGLHFSLWHSKITKFENHSKMSYLNFPKIFSDFLTIWISHQKRQNFFCWFLKIFEFSRQNLFFLVLDYLNFRAKNDKNSIFVNF